MFIVKRLGRNGMWNAVSLIDENGSFRGEAKFETRKEADDYLAIYVKRMENRLGISAEARAQVKVFDDKPEPEMPIRPVKAKKAKKVKRVKKRKNKMKHSK